jgi:signal transduction histidine kinase
MSLFRRISVAFAAIIVLTVLVSGGVDYVSTWKNLPLFVTKIHTENIAAGLSRFYTLEKSWAGLDGTIRRNGYLQVADRVSGADDGVLDLSIHLVVRDAAGRTLYNSFATLLRAGTDPLVKGGTEALYDHETGAAVGSVTTYINRGYLEREAAVYLKNMLPERLFQAVLTALAAAVPAFVLSRRIAAPIVSLGEAAQEIVRSGTVGELPVTSTDELGGMTSAFNQMTQHLQTQRELRRRLISDVSHELGTPLNVIKLEAHGALDQLKPADDAFYQIMDEVNKLSSLVDDLNWLAETDSGVLQLEKVPCRCERFVTDEVARWQVQSEAAGVRLELAALPRNLPSLQIDVEHMSRVLGNLIENGLKYTPAGGVVTVSCRHRPGEVTITVKDSGVGIMPADLPFIFDRFYRADRSRHVSTGGRGLGLSIVRQIVEMHGGTVWAESKSHDENGTRPEGAAGWGSSFHVRLPVA